MPSPEMQRIISRLERHLSIFDFTIDDLGDDLLRIASVGAHTALLRGEDIEGNALAELSEAYEAWKSRKYPGLPIGFLELEMGRLDNFLGETVVGSDEAIVVYGLNDDAKDEIAWFCEGDPANNRPARNVWGLTAESKAESKDRLDDRFHSSI